MIELDDIDKRIVAALQAEGRLPIVDLADRVGLSGTPCQRRGKRLEEEGAITRYAAHGSPARSAPCGVGGRPRRGAGGGGARSHWPIIRRSPSMLARPRSPPAPR